MGSKWRKAKMALGLNMCLYVPETDQEQRSAEVSRRFSDAVSLSPVDTHSSTTPTPTPTPTPIPTPSSSGLRFSRSGSKHSKKTCAICLTSIKTGHGHAIFTAECSHSFHFHCIASNVKHGNQICPICRAKWKEVPFENPLPPDVPNRRSRVNPMGRSQDEAWMNNVVRQIPQPRLGPSRPISSLVYVPEPICFDDDEELDGGTETTEKTVPPNGDGDGDGGGDGGGGDLSSSCPWTMEVKTYPEVPAIPRSQSNDNFTVLIHLKAPRAKIQNESHNERTRAPVDLVTVLDVSGSMSGTKLALLKRAMGFVVQNLGPSDRLSVIAFSSTARRLFPLRRMTDSGREQALLLVNSLTSNGGTNIAEGLKKSAKIMAERKWKNAVASIMLLSDGQDTYNVRGSGAAQRRVDSRSLVPPGLQIPVHTFGFGADHDASAMHSISELSGGTFSFIEAENVIQDAFAQCIGGILSVVVQELEVELECCAKNPSLRLGSIKSGSYRSSVAPDGRTGSIKVGDLYAEEERDFLVTVKVPAFDDDDSEMPLLMVKYVFRDPITKEFVSMEEAREVTIQRPNNVEELEASVEVDRQRNRLYAAEAMGEAKAAAERSDLAAAVSVLETCSRALSESVSAKAGDRLCASLCVELKEMQERMANRRVYESTGRAYVLSGLSSHSWQRATTRGDSTNCDSLVQSYQTPTMTNMVTQSQTMVFGEAPTTASPRRKLRQTLSFPSGPRPR